MGHVLHGSYKRNWARAVKRPMELRERFRFVSTTTADTVVPLPVIVVRSNCGHEIQARFANSVLLLGHSLEYHLPLLLSRFCLIYQASMNPVHFTARVHGQLYISLVLSLLHLHTPKHYGRHDAVKFKRASSFTQPFVCSLHLRCARLVSIVCIQYLLHLVIHPYFGSLFISNLSLLFLYDLWIRCVKIFRVQLTIHWVIVRKTVNWNWGSRSPLQVWFRQDFASFGDREC